MLRAALLDLDHTLYDYRPCHAAGMQAMLQLAEEKLGLDKEGFRTAYRQAQEENKRLLVGTAAEHSRLHYAKLIVESLLDETDAALCLAMEESYWSAYLDAMQLYPGVSDFLDYCREQWIRTGIVTNLTTAIQLRKIQALGIVVGLVVTSEEAGVEKPEPGIFKLALDRIGCQAQEALFIGDDAHRDIAGARAMGMRARQIHSGKDWDDWKTFLES
ncbi:hypothetical protein AUJ68_06380 [Candidatus Woesearchaeota archaeon CG1_02_57_44]|nr:MAG: hypothetical protein AUJ68_06380 [Candidatus Woesearchaeota archaeon CG1_02_57_44]